MSNQLIPEFITRHFSAETAERACRVLWEIEKRGKDGAVMQEIRRGAPADYQAIKYVIRKLEELGLVEKEVNAADSRGHLYSLTPIFVANIGSLRNLYEKGLGAGIEENSDYSYIFFNKYSGIPLTVNDLMGSMATSSMSVEKFRLLAGLLLAWSLNGRGYTTGVDRNLVRAVAEDTVRYFEGVADLLRQLLASDYLAGKNSNSNPEAVLEMYSPLTKDGEFTLKEVENETGWNRELAAQVLHYLRDNPSLRERLGNLRTETLEVTLGVILDKLSE